MAPDGSDQKPLTSGAQSIFPVWSPDGAKIVYSRWSGSWYDILVMNADGSNPQLVVANATYPAISPDGTKLAYYKIPGPNPNNYNLYVANFDGTNEINLSATVGLTGYEAPANPTAWGTNGRILITAQEPYWQNTTDYDIYWVAADGSGYGVVLNESNRYSDSAGWSPDASQIVFKSARSGNADIWIMNADGTNLRQLTTFAGEDQYPSWGAIDPTWGVVTANAGTDQSVNEGTLVTLDGSASIGADLTYQWIQIAGLDVSLSGQATPFPTFTPNLQGGFGCQTLTFELTVTSWGRTSSDTVNVIVCNVNHAPEAMTGADLVVNEGSPVMLDGTASYDPDGDPISFQWVQTSGPAVELSAANTATPTLIAPFLPGGVGGSSALAFELTVSDGVLSASVSIQVTVEQVNHPPTAVAGLPQTVRSGASVILNATGSADPDGDPLFYQWTQVSGPGVNLLQADTVTPSFTAPHVSGTVALVFRLVVSDGQLVSDPAEVTVTVKNGPPLCELGRPEPALLWPPNHAMAAINIVGVTDPDDASVTVNVVGVTQDEPVNGTGDGDTAPDAVLQGTTAYLRAERSGAGNGRVYVLIFTANDGLGGSCTGTTQVIVPHNKKSGAIDDGQFFDSTVP